MTEETKKKTAFVQHAREIALQMLAAPEDTSALALLMNSQVFGHELANEPRAVFIGKLGSEAPDVVVSFHVSWLEGKFPHEIAEQIALACRDKASQ